MTRYIYNRRLALVAAANISLAAQGKRLATLAGCVASIHLRVADLIRRSKRLIRVSHVFRKTFRREALPEIIPATTISRA